MATSTWTVLMLTPLVASIAIGYAGEASAAKPQERQAAKAEKKPEKKPEIKAEKDAAKLSKPVRIKAPPKPGVKTVIAPGTWKVHKHRGNSPLFKDGREKDWVTRPGPGKRPVIKRPDRPGNGKDPGNR